MIISLVTAATEKPITLGDAKEHLNITDASRDAEVNAKLSAATEYCQRNIPGHRQFMQATYDVSFAEFPDGETIELPLPPLSSVTSVKYYDTDGVQQTFSSTKYSTVTPSDDPGYVELGYGETWPSTRARTDAVTIRFVAGSTAASETVKEAVRLKLEHLYDPGRVDERQIDRAINDLLACNRTGGYR